jgi:hypothetical protein
MKFENTQMNTYFIKQLSIYRFFAAPLFLFVFFINTPIICMNQIDTSDEQAMDIEQVLEWRAGDQKIILGALCHRCPTLGYATVVTMASVNKQWHTLIKETVSLRKQVMNALILQHFTNVIIWHSDAVYFHPLGCAASFLIDDAVQVSLCRIQLPDHPNDQALEKRRELVIFEYHMESPYFRPYTINYLPKTRHLIVEKDTANYIVFSTPFFEYGNACVQRRSVFDTKEQECKEISINKEGNLLTKIIERSDKILL